MRRWPVLMSLAVLSACAGPTVRPWHKEGADQQTIAQDDAGCRSIAQQEALRRYPYGFNTQFVGPGSSTISQQQDDVNRRGTEEAAFNRCMGERGYRR